MHDARLRLITSRGPPVPLPLPPGPPVRLDGSGRWFLIKTGFPSPLSRRVLASSYRGESPSRESLCCLPLSTPRPNGEFAADTGCSIYGCDVCQPLGMVAAIFGLDASRGIECNNPNGHTEPPAGECCLVNNGYYCCCEGEGCEPFTPGEDCPYGDSPEPSSVPTPYPTLGGPL